ncbi:hypothetical protein HPP92_021097 [Vanilla planifolia]|uniref:Uncharacterized protein n=1 Tax=Vanilla planifolia TaxID=51239 RepID=A0A835PY25_VANPL|nr:hypothetical protein HPP92_021097 [Vanilla planifolia]
MSCPANAFQYNGSLCACDPGYWRQGNGSCALFSGADWVTSSGVGASSTFLSTVLPLENIRRFTQSQAVLLEATVAVLLFWLLFCFLLRFAPLRSSRRPLWFRLRCTKVEALKAKFSPKEELDVVESTFKHEFERLVEELLTLFEHEIKLVVNEEIKKFISENNIEIE